MQISLVYTCRLLIPEAAWPSRRRSAVFTGKEAELFCLFSSQSLLSEDIFIIRFTQTAEGDLSILLLQNTQLNLFTDGVFVLWCVETGRAIDVIRVCRIKSGSKVIFSSP